MSRPLRLLFKMFKNLSDNGKDMSDMDLAIINCSFGNL